MARSTGITTLAPHCPPNMPLLTELGWCPGVLLQTCHSYGVALPRSSSTGNSEEPDSVSRHQAALKMSPCRSPFAKKTLQPFAHRCSNSPMQAKDLANAARLRPTWAKPIDQELIPGLGSNMHLVGKLSHAINP
jgi:hypothetical protein